MFTKEFLELFTQLIKSWQVIVVTVGLVIYVYLVSYVARSYRRPKVKKVKTRSKKFAPAQSSGPEEIESSGNSNDELGLEEA